MSKKESEGFIVLSGDVINRIHEYYKENRDRRSNTSTVVFRVAISKDIVTYKGVRHCKITKREVQHHHNGEPYYSRF